MKNLIANLKSLGFKRVMIEHCEKMVLGLVVLMVLIVLARTSWSRYDRDPSEFTDKVNTALSALQASVWPEDERQTFANAQDTSQAVDELFGAVDVTSYQFSTPWNWPLYEPKKKIQAPDWLVVQSLVADAGRVIIEFKPDQPGSDQVIGIEIAQPEATPDAADPASSDLNPRGAQPSSGGEFAPRGASAPGGAAGSGGAFDATQGAAAIPGPGAFAGSSGHAESGGRSRPGGPAAIGSMPGAGNMPGMQGSMFGDAQSAQTGGDNAEGLRFIAIRGIFPLKEQISLIQRAMNLSTSTDAFANIDFRDFVVERQVALPGPNPWSGSWEKVDVQIAFDIIDRVAAWDVDPVETALTDAVFTMPLPQRVAGFWDEFATHPDIRALRQELAELQDRVNQKAIEVYQRTTKKRGELGKKGFAKQQHDVKDIRNQLTGQMQELTKNATTEYMAESGFNMGSGAGSAAQSAIAGRVLLFRYFDFDVKPGNAYRYRASLVVHNPLYGRPVEELVNPAVAEVREITTKPSEPSNPAVIVDDSAYYLTKVKSGSSAGDTADIEVVQWYADAGTTVNCNIEKLATGHIVGGSRKAKVLRPAAKTLREEEGVKFSEDRILVDILAGPQLSRQNHPDLNEGVKPGRILPADQALVVDERGELLALDTVTSLPYRDAALKNLEKQRAPWIPLLVQTNDKSQGSAAGAGSAGGLGDLVAKYNKSDTAAGAGHGGDSAAKTAKKRYQGRKSSALRKSAGGFEGGMGAGGMGAGGMGAGGMGAGAHGE